MRTLPFGVSPCALLLVAPLLVRAQPGTRLARDSGLSTNVPARLNDGWSVSTPEAVGLDRGPLDRLTESLRRWPEINVHAVLVERQGKLVYEAYFPGVDQRWGQPLGRVTFGTDTKHDLRSVTKSVVSALVGVAINDGKIRSVDQPLLDFFPEYRDLASAERRRLTLRHALGMTAGLEWNEDIPYTDPRNDEIRMTLDSTPLRFALGKRFQHDPGSEWTYNGGLTQVVAAVLERATGRPLEDYARAVLFEPVGITDVEWVGDLAGMPSAASGLRLRPRDLAKIGSLYLHGGRWNGRQVLPAAWVEESTRRLFAFRPREGDPGRYGYGFFWWYNCYSTPAGLVEARTAVGNGQQRVFVLPGLDMVVTVLSGRYNDPSAGSLGARVLREYILPAVTSGARYGCSA